MYFIENTLYITFPELVSAGISENTIRQASVRGSTSWSLRKDPMDKRRLLVAYEGLREAYKEKITRRYGNPYNYCSEQKRKQNALNALLEVPPEEARAIKFSPSEGVPWMDDIKQSCTHTLCGYVRAYLRLKDKALRSSFGYETHEEAVGALLQMACEQRDEVPVTFSGLRKRVKVYEEHGVQGLFPKEFTKQECTQSARGAPTRPDGLLEQPSQQHRCRKGAGNLQPRHPEGGR